MIFNPRTYDPTHLDAESRRLLRATVDFFEERGKKALMAGYIDRAWYSDFLDFAAKEAFSGPIAALVGVGFLILTVTAFALGPKPGTEAPPEAQATAAVGRD